MCFLNLIDSFILFFLFDRLKLGAEILTILNTRVDCKVNLALSLGLGPSLAPETRVIYDCKQSVMKASIKRRHCFGLLFVFLTLFD